VSYQFSRRVNELVRILAGAALHDKVLSLNETKF
jgi:hypothetical protein